MQDAPMNGERYPDCRRVSAGTTISRLGVSLGCEVVSDSKPGLTPKRLMCEPQLLHIQSTFR